MSDSPRPTPPRWVFIVPYRDRAPQRFFLQNYMTYLMEDYVEHDGVTGDYLLLFIEQMDDRPFNRGAMKNVGFLAVKRLFPDAYGDVVLVFNDVDVLPYAKNMLRYEPPAGGGAIMHHYGFEFALGGILSLRASDFEKMNGFANYWTWGFEDNVLQNRAQRHGIAIDRSNFFALNDMRILHLNDGNHKSLNRQYMYELISDTGTNGVSTILNLDYDVDLSQKAVNVRCFDVEYSPWNGTFETYDLRHGRDIHAPLSKKMMLDSARKGNSLDTLHFIDSDGKRKTTADLIHEEEQAQERERHARHAPPPAKGKPRKIMNFLPVHATAPRPLQSEPATPLPAAAAAQAAAGETASTHLVRPGGRNRPLMMSIRHTEERKHVDRALATANEHRARHQQRYGAFGLTVHKRATWDTPR